MMLLFDAYKMSSNNEKMRFLACEQVERCLQGLYPNTKIMPFGSSVNSFGKTHHILQEVSHPQPVLDAFNDLWDQLNNNNCIVWNSKD